MGASNSHETAQATPPRRILNIDPRSPSCDISRTPIVVDKTPEYALDDMDPRSPTVGIVRTPLSLIAQGNIILSGVQPTDIFLKMIIDTKYFFTSIFSVFMLLCKPPVKLPSLNYFHIFLLALYLIFQF